MVRIDHGCVRDRLKRLREGPAYLIEVRREDVKWTPPSYLGWLGVGGVAFSKWSLSWIADQFKCQFECSTSDKGTDSWQEGQDHDGSSVNQYFLGRRLL